MSINIRKLGEVADGSITADKLADGAVDLGSIKVTGQAPSSKIEDSAITEQKLNDLAVSTAKLQNAAVTLGKASNDVKISHFVGNETEVSVEGTVETAVKSFNFFKLTGIYVPARIRAIVTMRTSAAASQATLSIYFDSEPIPRIAFNSSSEDYELLNAEVDVSDLNVGLHTATIKMASADPAETAYNELIDILWIKG